MPKTCPECGREWPVTSKALGCWLGHAPDLPTRLTLQEMADALAPISRERLRQLLNKLGEHRRRGNVRKPVDLEARRRYFREYARTPRWKEAKERRHKERMQADPEYRERRRARWRAKYARRKQRRSEGKSSG